MYAPDDIELNNIFVTHLPYCDVCSDTINVILLLGGCQYNRDLPTFVMKNITEKILVFCSWSFTTEPV